LSKKCVVCRFGKTSPGETTVSITHDSVTLVVKGLPADVCENCGEDYVSEEVGAWLMRSAREAKAAGVELDVRRYAA
jgi:YgiT-type zinc finger domain-containing protein